jgi:hypothetical protein
MAVLTRNQRWVRVGLDAKPIAPWSGSEEKFFLLTSPFIELSGEAIRLGRRRIGQISQPWLNSATLVAPFTQHSLQPIVVCNQRQGWKAAMDKIGGFGDSFGEPTLSASSSLALQVDSATASTAKPVAGL